MLSDYQTLKGFNLNCELECLMLFLFNPFRLLLKLHCQILQVKPGAIIIQSFGINVYSLYNSLLHLRLTVMFNSNSIAEGLRDGSDSPQHSED